MLKNIPPILSPDLLHALRAMGHGDEIVIVDANYPAESAGPPVIRLDGLLATDVADAVLSLLPLDDFVEEQAFAMEVVGISPTLKLAVESVRVGGSVGLVGNIHAEATLPLQAAVTRELTLYGSCAVCGEYPEAIAAIADGTIQVKPLISAVAPLAEGSDWFGRLYAGKEDLIKVILQP